MLERLTTISIEVRNFALVTHVVPSDRVRALLPREYELDTFEQEGQQLTWVSATCFCNGGFRWSALPYPRMTFDESTYRTYVVHKGRRGVYFFRRYLSGLRAFAPQRLFEMNAVTADFDVEVEAGREGYDLYSCRATSHVGESSFAIRAKEVGVVRPPFSTSDELAQYITYRLHGFFTSSVGLQGHMPVSHGRMQPWFGELLSGRFDTWVELGILTVDEAGAPDSVLVAPVVDFKLHPPRPLL